MCILIFSLFIPLSASATVSGSCGDKISYSLSGTTLTISGKGAMTNFSDENMAPWYGEDIKKIFVEEGVSSIGTLAFFGCKNLTNVSLPSTVTTIGVRAFKNCTALSYINMPSALTRISEAAFENCSSLSQIALPTGLLHIGDYAFYRCSSLISITIPSSVIDLGLVTFAYCGSLLQAYILCPITKIPDWTFYGCTSLNKVILPETVVSSGEMSFHDCSNLATITYTGTNSAQILDSIKNDGTSAGTTDTGIWDKVDGDEPGNTTKRNSGSNVSSDLFITQENLPLVTSFAGNDDPSSYTTTSKTVEVDTGENTTITVTKTETSTYSVDGEKATAGEALTAAIGDDGKKVAVEKRTDTAVSAIVNSSEDFQEIIGKVNENIRKNEKADGETVIGSMAVTTDSTVKVNIQLTDTKVSGSDLSSIAGKAVEMQITTSNGDTWVIDQLIQNKGSFSKDEYDLSVTTTKQDKIIKGIESEEIYKVKFSDSIDFSTSVGIAVSTGNVRQYATFFEMNGGKMNELQTVVVDNDGVAWFSVAGVNERTDYYIGINVKGVDTSNARIPDSLQSDYGIDENTLMDESGTKYVVGGRTSRWGITGEQFAIYAAIGIGALVLIVSGVMITLNNINRNKNKWRAKAEKDKAEDAIDEEALRLEIMKELLEAKDRK